MKVFGQLEKAQLENLTADPTGAGLVAGIIWYRTDQKLFKVYDGAAVQTFVDLNTAQTLSNKILASPELTGNLLLNQTTTPATPAAGKNRFYVKADNKLYTLDSAGNEAQVGSGSGGGVTNLITNGSADDSAASIFVPYLDSGTRPVDGTGGTTTGITTSVSSTSPLNGSKSYLLTKDAANRQGGGWAVPFSVDLAYRAKSLKISVDFIVNSGTFVSGSSTTDSDVIWYIYDVTNSTLIEPSNIKMFSNSTTLTDKFEATFQTSATGSSYRLIAHVASTSASAYELKVDNVTVSPQVYVYGSPVTDERSFTPTLSNATNVTVVSANFSRIGDKLRCTGYLTWSGNGAGSTFTFSLPPGYAIDTTKISSVVENIQLGTGFWLESGVARKGINVVYNTTTAVSFDEITTGLGSLVGTAFSNGDAISFDFIVPAVGLSSSVQMSDSADTRVVLGTATIASSATTTNNGIIQFNTVTKDTHGAITTGASWKYTVQAAGDYRVSINMDVNTACNYRVFLNGSSAGYIVSAPTSLFGFGQRTLVNLKAGDYIHFVSDTGGTVQATSYMSIERISGPQAIAVSESINLKYTNTAGTTVGTGATIIPFGTKVYDTHGAYVTNTFTAPTAGKYQVSFHLLTNTVTLTTTQAIEGYVYKNGALHTSIGRINGTGGASNNYAIQGVTDVDLLAGETLDVRALSNVSVNLITTNASYNSIEIKRVGN